MYLFMKYMIHIVEVDVFKIRHFVISTIRLRANDESRPLLLIFMYNVCLLMLLIFDMKLTDVLIFGTTAGFEGGGGGGLGECLRRQGFPLLTSGCYNGANANGQLKLDRVQAS